ncbi:MAG: MFS transporter [Acidimicrobiales bacterium]
MGDQVSSDCEEGSEPRVHKSTWRAIVFAVPPFLLGVTVLGRSSQNMAQTSYPLLGREVLGVGAGLLGVVVAAAGIAGVMSASLVAARAPTRDCLRVLLVGEVLGAASFVLFALPTGTPGLCVGAIALGAGGGLMFPSLMTAIGQVALEDRGRALAVFAVALSSSLLVGPLVEAAVLHVVGGSLRGAFGVLLPVPVAATVISAVAFFKERTVLGGHEPGVRERTPSTPIPSDTTLYSPTRTSTSSNIQGKTDGSDAVTLAGSSARGVLSNHGFRVAALTMFSYQIPFVALVAFGGLLAHRVDGVSLSGVQLAFAAFFGVSLLVRAVVAAVSPIRRKAPLLLAAMVLSVVGIAMIGLGRGAGVLVGAMVVLGAPHGANFPLASATLAEQTSNRDLGRANARLMAITSLPTVVVPVIAGWLIASVGYSTMFMLLDIPVGLLSVALVAELVREHRLS